MTQTSRNPLNFNDLESRFGVNEKQLPILIRLGIVPLIHYLISQE